MFDKEIKTRQVNSWVFSQLQHNRMECLCTSPLNRKMGRSLSVCVFHRKGILSKKKESDNDDRRFSECWSCLPNYTRAHRMNQETCRTRAPTSLEQID